MFWIEFLKKLPAKWMPAIILFLWVAFWGIGIKLGFHKNILLPVVIIGTIIVLIVWAVLMLITAKKVKKDIESRRLAELARSGLEKTKRIEEKLLYAIKSIRESKLGKDVGKKDAQYSVPWFMMIGPEGSGKTSLLMESGLDFRLRDPSSSELAAGPTKNCDWLFANEAIVMDTTGRYVTQKDKSLDKAEWLSLLDYLKRHRSTKPIDGLILAVDISRILKSGDDEIDREAQSIRDRIDEIIEQLGISFPVYLIFTKCDMIYGFTQFFGDLTKEERDQILGCSFTPQQQSNIASAFKDEWTAIYESLKSRVFVKLNPDTNPGDRGSIYLFPRQIDAMYGKVNHFVSTLFRPSTYLDRPSLNGFYLTSSLQELAPVDLIMESISKSSDIQASSVPPSAESKSYFIKDMLARAILPTKDLASPTVRAQRKTLKKWLIPLAIEFALLAIILLFTGISYSRNRELLNESQRFSNVAYDTSQIADLQNYIGKLRSFHIFPWRGQRHKVAKALEAKYFINVSVKVVKIASGEKPKPVSNAMVYEESSQKGIKTDRSGEGRLVAFKGAGVGQVRIRVDYQEPGWGLDKAIIETNRGKSETMLFEPVITLNAAESPRSLQIVFAKLRVLSVQAFDDKKAPVPGVPVSVMDPNMSVMLSSGFSDDTGAARLEFRANDGSVLNVNYGESGISYPSSKQLRVDPGKYDYSIEEMLRTKPPVFDISLESPQDNFVTKDQTVKIKGRVLALSKNASMDGVFVKVGAQAVPIAAGEFSFDLPINEGRNSVPITVANATQSLSQTIVKMVTRVLEKKDSGSSSAGTVPAVVSAPTANITPTTNTTVTPAVTAPVTTPQGTSPQLAAKPVIARIEISPSTIRIKPGEQKMFTAKAYDASNKPIPNVQFSWNINGDIGQIDRASGVFTARKSGAGQVTVASEGKIGAAQVNVVEAAWKIISNQNKDFKDLYFVDDRTGWAVGYPMLVARTDDGGSGWRMQIDGNSNVVKLSDGSSFGADKLKSALNAVHFIKSGDKTIGWAVGEKGIVLHSPDGDKWVQQTSFVDVTLWGVYFVNASNGWAVGRNGTIIYTTNGGVKWTKQKSVSNNIVFYNVFFLDSNRGWIVGQGGTILSTTDGGNNWSVQTTPASKKPFLRDVCFVSPLRGWIVGTEGWIMHTNNGGQTWAIQESRTLYNLFGVKFLNDNQGWAVGENGTILKTSDGGKTWTQNQIGSQNFFGISATGSGGAWAIGAKGAIASYAMP